VRVVLEGLALKKFLKRVCLFVCCFDATVPTGPGSPHSRCFWITHNDAPRSVVLPWTSDQLVTETST